jgi:hypothetical protein
MIQFVRTTLNLDDGIFHVARQLAQRRGKTIGQIVSEPARQALEPWHSPKVHNGTPLFTPQPGAPKPHLARINRLRDEELLAGARRSPGRQAGDF